MKRQLDAAVANRGRSPRPGLRREASRQVNTSNHYTSQPLTAERVAALDRAKMLAFYKQRFANAADFTFFMVGAFKIDEALPLLARYVGGAAVDRHAPSAFKDVGIRFPDRRSSAHGARRDASRAAQTVISFFADPPLDAVEQEKRRSRRRRCSRPCCATSLREDLGQTYTVSVGLAQSPPQRGGGYIGVNFGAAPENIGAMTDRVLQEVQRLQAEGPSADLVAKAREGARRDYETALKQNAYWMRRLQTMHLLGRDPGDIITRSQRIDGVTPAVLQEVFKKYFPLDRYTVVTLVPEPSTQQ